MSTVRLAPLRVLSDQVIIHTSSHFNVDLEQLKTETDPQKRLQIIIDLLRKQEPTAYSYANHPTGGPKRQKLEELEDEVTKELRTFQGPPEILVQIVKHLSLEELEVFAQASSNTLKTVLSVYANMKTEDLFKLFIEVFFLPQANEEQWRSNQQWQGEKKPRFWKQFKQRWYESLYHLLQTREAVLLQNDFFPPTYGNPQLHRTLDGISGELIRKKGFVKSLFTDETPGIIHNLMFFHECIATDFFGYRRDSVIDRKVFEHHVTQRMEVVRLYKTIVIKLLYEVLERMILAKDQEFWTAGEDDADLEFMLRFLALFPPELPIPGANSANRIMRILDSSTLWSLIPEEMMVSIVKPPKSVRGSHWWPASATGSSDMRTHELRFTEDSFHSWNNFKPSIFEMIRPGEQIPHDLSRPGRRPDTLNRWKPVSIFHCLFQRGSMHPGSWRRTPKEVFLGVEQFIYGPKEAMRAVLQQLLQMLEILKTLKLISRLNFEFNGEILMFLNGSAFVDHPFNITPYTRTAGIDGKEMMDPSFVWHRHDVDNDWFIREVRLLDIETTFSIPQ